LCGFFAFGNANISFSKRISSCKAKFYRAVISQQCSALPWCFVIAHKKELTTNKVSGTYPKSLIRLVGRVLFAERSERQGSGHQLQIFDLVSWSGSYFI